MMLYYLFAQSDTVNMGVNFGGRNTFVSEHCLNDSKIGSSLQQMRRKGVSESMRTYILFYSGKQHKLLYQMKDRYSGEWPASAEAQKEKLLATGLYSYGIPFVDIILKFGYRSRRDRHQTLLVALAKNPYEFIVEIKVREAQIAKFRHTQSAAI